MFQNAPDLHSRLQHVNQQLNELNHLKMVHSLAIATANISKAISVSNYSAVYDYIRSLAQSSDLSLVCFLS